MSEYQDGSYITKQGTALIAKVLASDGQTGLHFTKATVGKGQLPSDTAPGDMTALADEVMEGRIASLENNNNGEVSIVVQVASAQTAFVLTEIGLWAEDPDLGEILYTYVVLKESPEVIRAAEAAVNKLAVFTIVTIVDSVAHVSVEINQDSFVSKDEVENIVNTILVDYVPNPHTHEISEITGLEAELAKMATTAMYVIEIPTEGWTDETDQFSIDIALEGIRSTDSPIAAPIYSTDAEIRASEGAAWNGIEMLITSNNNIKLYASAIPAVALTIQLKVVR